MKIHACWRFVFVDLDENIISLGDDPHLLNEKVLTKYYNELAKLDNSNMCVGDGRY